MMMSIASKHLPFPRFNWTQTPLYIYTSIMQDKEQKYKMMNSSAGISLLVSSISPHVRHFSALILDFLHSHAHAHHLTYRGHAWSTMEIAVLAHVEVVVGCMKSLALWWRHTVRRVQQENRMSASHLLLLTLLHGTVSQITHSWSQSLRVAKKLFKRISLNRRSSLFHRFIVLWNVRRSIV